MTSDTKVEVQFGDVTVKCDVDTAAQLIARLAGTSMHPTPGEDTRHGSNGHSATAYVPGPEIGDLRGMARTVAVLKLVRDAGAPGLALKDMVGRVGMEDTRGLGGLTSGLAKALGKSGLKLN